MGKVIRVEIFVDNERESLIQLSMTKGYVKIIQDWLERQPVVMDEIDDQISTKNKGCGKHFIDFWNDENKIKVRCGEVFNGKLRLCDECQKSTKKGCGKDETPNAVLTNVCGETIHDGQIWYCNECKKLTKENKEIAKEKKE